jgi:predicted outer membrane protein
MDDRELRKLIEQLQIEIQNTRTVNEKDQEMLVQLESEIREFLARTGENEVHFHPTTIKRLEDGLSHFETTHPTLTSLISQLLDALSNAGI